ATARAGALIDAHRIAAARVSELRRRTSRRARGRSAGFADRADQIPLAHLGAAGNLLLPCEVVELLAVPVLERVPGLAAPLPPPRRLLAELAPRALRQVRDRP